MTLFKKLFVLALWFVCAALAVWTSHASLGDLTAAAVILASAAAFLFVWTLDYAYSRRSALNRLSGATVTAWVAGVVLAVLDLDAVSAVASLLCAALLLPLTLRTIGAPK